MKIISIALVIIMTSVCFISCSGNGNAADDTTVATDTTAETTLFHVEVDPTEKSLYDADFPHSEYITLKEYSDTHVKFPKKFIVDDEFVDGVILSEAVSYGYVDKDDSITAIEPGHAVSIDYESTIDGEEYSGGSQSDYIILIGAGMFVQEIEDALIGKTAGDSFEISAKYPDDYPTSTLCGKTADFSITVNYVGTPQTVTDEIVNETTFGEYKTLAELKKFYTEYYTYLFDQNYKAGRNEAIWNILSEASEIIKLPVCDRVDYCDSMVDYFASLAESYGYSYAEFVEAQGYTENEFYEYLYEDLSEDAVNQKLILSAVCKKEGISMEISEEEYNNYLKDNYTSYGYNSPEELEAALGRVNITDTVLLDKVIEALVQVLNITEE